MSIDYVKKRLFMFYEYSLGQLILLPKGVIMMSKLKSIVRKLYIDHDFEEVSSPTFGDKRIWDKTGHTKFFADNMYFFDEKYYLKPMNCPMHIAIMDNIYSINSKFPIRVFEFNYCFRREPSGAVGGLTRLTRFTQDDSHQIVHKSDIKDSLLNFVNITKSLYQKMEMNKFKFRFSKIDPDNVIDINKCLEAQNVIQQFLDDNKIDYFSEQDGAFYGPKLDIIIVDSNKKEWQTGTFQIDFCLLKNLDFVMRNNDNIDDFCVLHCAFLGTFERFLGVIFNMLDHIPSSIMPFKYYFVSVNNDVESDKFFKRIEEQFLNSNCCDYFYDNRKVDVRSKVKIAEQFMYSYIIFIGPKEIENNFISYRMYKDKNIKVANMLEFFK